MIERFIKRRIAVVKRLLTILLTMMLTITAVVPCIPAMPVYATAVTPAGPVIVEVIKDGLTWVAGELAVGIGTDLVSKGIEYFNKPSETTNINNLNTYYYRGNTSTTNTTTNYKVFNDYTKTTNTVNNYKYSFYNPVTNTYNYTNNYNYNQQYNTYNYTTYNTTNNYTTNYYVTNNNTYISYYIVEEDTSTGATFESYYEIYFKLPDGRNSYNLKKEDIWGTYFVYDYSKYESVPEDDGKTLGLWHLDGDTKDSSYHGNTSGSYYTTTFKDAKFEGGKYLSSSYNDFLELKLDKVSLPSSYTLEWIQYVSDNDWTSLDSEYSPSVTESKCNSAYTVYEYTQHNSYGGDLHYCCFSHARRYITNKYVKNSGVCGIDGSNNFYDLPRASFVYCCLIFDGSNYNFYINGNKVDSTKDYSGAGLSINNDRIRFYCVRKNIFNSDYKETILGETKVVLGSNIQVYNNTCGNGVKNNINLWLIRHDFNRDSYYYDVNFDTTIDEVRLSKGALYTGNYTPSNQAYTTNTVLVVPENPADNEVAFKTNYNLGNIRFGGARPTYPVTGDVFIAVTDNKVESVQQYQESGWYEIPGSIYYNGKWEELKNFDVTKVTVIEPTVPDNPDPDKPDPDNPDPDKPDPDNPDPDNPDPDNPDPDKPDPDKPDDKDSIWDKIGKLFASLLGIVEKLISPLIDGIIGLINMIMEAIGALTNISEGFSNFLKGTFIFIPEDILSIIGLGIMLTIFASIIKIFL